MCQKGSRTKQSWQREPPTLDSAPLSLCSRPVLHCRIASLSAPPGSAPPARSSRDDGLEAVAQPSVVYYPPPFFFLTLFYLSTSSTAAPHPPPNPKTMAGGRISSDVELMSVRSAFSDAGADQAFPNLYRREYTRGPSMSGEYDRNKVRPRSPPRLADEDVGDDRVEYVPIPEEKKLGYFSTAALIVSKMIGTGIFAKPSVVFAHSGGKGVALFLWVACGLMSMAGYAPNEMGRAMDRRKAESNTAMQALDIRRDGNNPALLGRRGCLRKEPRAADPRVTRSALTITPRSKNAIRVQSTLPSL